MQMNLLRKVSLLEFRAASSSDAVKPTPCALIDLGRTCATMLAAGSDTPFTWNYVDGSDLKSSLTYPNGLTASWPYDANGQLLQVKNAFDVAAAPLPREEFVPQFDDDGNQTLVQTSTGIWQFQCNGEKRPILWSCIQSNNSNNPNNQTISMSYDRMGRRVTQNAQRFVYNCYLLTAGVSSTTTSTVLDAVGSAAEGTQTLGNRHEEVRTEIDVEF